MTTYCVISQTCSVHEIVSLIDASKLTCQIIGRIRVLCGMKGRRWENARKG